MIKLKVMKALSEIDGTFTRQQIQMRIWIAQGKKSEDFVNRQGYYSDAIQEWTKQGLIQRQLRKGIYCITDDGRLYACNKKEWLRRRRIERAEKRELMEREIQISNGLRNELAHDFQHLIGKTIENVRYLDAKECGDLGWNKAPIVIELSDQTALTPQSDDEGNEGGALMIYDYHKQETDVIGTI